MSADPETLAGTRVHATALIDPTAQIGRDVEIGPWAIVGPNCEVADGARIGARATLERNVRLGQRVSVGIGAILGGDPQDHKFRGQEPCGDLGC